MKEGSPYSTVSKAVDEHEDQKEGPAEGENEV